MLLSSLEGGETTAFIQLDQSKAYDVVSHHLLLLKMKALGFNRKTLNIFKNYLLDRKQYITVESFDLETLLVGPQSVTQGSMLSCVLYLIFILDITQIYHKVRHNPAEYSSCSSTDNFRFNDCNRTNANTYVDDNFLHTRPKPNQTLQEAVIDTIRMIEDYTNANKLALNPEKSCIMVISWNKEEKDNFSVTISGKELKHQIKLVVLGNVISEDLKWNCHVDTVVILALANRARTLKLATQCMDNKFKHIYATSIFMGKLGFAVDAWAGVGQGHLTKVQKLQDRVAKATLGKSGDRMSKSQRLKTLGWLPFRQEATLATMRITHKILNSGIPEEIAGKMHKNTTNLKLMSANKLRTKPKSLNKNLRTLSSFRNRAYFFNTLPHHLTELKDPKMFNKWMKAYLKDPAKLLKVIPKNVPKTFYERHRPKPGPNQTGHRRVLPERARQITGRARQSNNETQQSSAAVSASKSADPINPETGK